MHTIHSKFFYQICKECDEEDYTIVLFSYQKSFCFPKDKSNYSFVEVQTKWNIDNFEGIEKFEIKNENIIIDLERKLNNKVDKNILYKIEDKCPEYKPYIIYSTRQSVSSCIAKI